MEMVDSFPDKACVKAFMSGPVVLFQWSGNPGGKVRYVSPNVESVLGYDQEAFHSGGLTYREIVYPDDLERIEQEIGECFDRNCERLEQEYRVVHKDGSVRWLYNDMCMVRDDAGAVSHYNGYVVDITGHKEEEFFFRSVFRTAAGGVVAADLSGTVVRANDTMTKLLGRHPLGSPVAEMVVPEEREDFAAMLERVVQEKKPAQGEVRLRAVDGSSIPCLVNPAPLKDLEGQCAGVFFFVLDLSEQKKMEEGLQRAMEAEKKFLTAMSHEIRTPLNSVMGFLDLLGETSLNAIQKGYLQNAAVSSRHLMELVNDVLDVSKIRAGQLALLDEELNLEELLTECGVMISPRIGEEVTFQIDVEESDRSVKGDPVRIKQIFVNLLSNAAKFTKEGSIRLVLEEVKELPGNRLRYAVAVEDTGIGIAPGQQDQLFQAFRQAHTDPRHGGTGLGLYISHSLAAMMGGEIQVVSEEGRGSCFTVTLTLEKGAPAFSRFRLEGRKILVALGDGPLKERLAAKLREIGAEPLLPPITGKSVDIIDFAFREGAPDAAVADLDLLEEKGRIAVEVIGERFPEMKSVALRSEGSGEAVGFDTLLSKPCSLFRLLGELDRLAGGAARKKSRNFGELAVLVAEDVEMNVMLVEEMFDKIFGVTIDVARDGVEAVEAVKRKKYDIVFMDIQMPNMDGIEATREIRKLDAELPVVAMTANVFSQDSDTARKAGMTGYISKPVNREAVAEALADALARKRGEPSPPPENLIALAPPEAEDGAKEEEENGNVLEQAASHWRENFGDELVDAFMEETRQSIRKIVREMEDPATDETGMLRCVHSLKGALGNCGLAGLSGAAARLEAKMKEGADPAEVASDRAALVKKIGPFLEL